MKHPTSPTSSPPPRPPASKNTNAGIVATTVPFFCKNQIYFFQQLVPVHSKHFFVNKNHTEANVAGCDGFIDDFMTSNDEVYCFPSKYVALQLCDELGASKCVGVDKHRFRNTYHINNPDCLSLDQQSEPDWIMAQRANLDFDFNLQVNSSNFLFLQQNSYVCCHCFDLLRMFLGSGCNSAM